MKKIAIVLSLVVVFSSVLNAQVINEARSVVNFEISNMKTKIVTGTFGGMTGEVVFDAKNLVSSSFKVCIDAASVDTDNEKRDKHLRNEDFFEVETYPTICFVSKSIIKTAEGFQAKGQLVMHGVENEVTFDFTFENNKFVGSLELNRFDYKIGEGTKTFMVGEMVNLQIICILD